MSVPTENDERSDSMRNGLFCALAIAAAVLIANPIANISFIDAFSYDKTALDFARTGHFVYNGGATAMLGWLIPWGALFIKLFGFSFNVMRFSMLPIAMATVYLFHQILRRFGINPGNAVLGALTLALSPLFLPLAASYMTDVPGLLVILVCIYMCQRAVATQTDQAAVLWLCSAMVVNVAGGTVRQIAWLGALIMVPSTAWLLRERRGMKVAGVLLWICSFIGVLACLYWFNQQPYSLRTDIIIGPIHPKIFVHLGSQLFKTFLCLLLIVFPVSAAWLPQIRRLSGRAKQHFIAAMVALSGIAIVLNVRQLLDNWAMPWLTDVIASQGFTVPGALGLAPATMTNLSRTVVSLLVIAPALVMAELLAARQIIRMKEWNPGPSPWNELTWILGPFSISYVLLLAPSGSFSNIRDRYVLALFSVAIIVLLRLYQERIAWRLPSWNFVVLALVAIYSVSGTHDFYAKFRALSPTIQMVQRSGVERRFIEAGFSSDGWEQIKDGGHMNDPRILVPAGAYRPNLYELNIPEGCRNQYSQFMPAISPKYFIDTDPLPCFAPTKYPPAHYTTWLPPFHRALYVQQLKTDMK